jgi:hypothetical protein
LQSISFFSRGRIDAKSSRRAERGFVLAAALLIAVLYFALMELMLLDSTRAFQDAQRFRSHVIAATLAEDGAELAAAGMVTKSGANVDRDDLQGTVSGNYVRSGNNFELTSNFELTGNASTKGVPPASAHVRLQGRITGTTVSIDYSTHSQ